MFVFSWRSCALCWLTKTWRQLQRKTLSKVAHEDHVGKFYKREEARVHGQKQWWSHDDQGRLQKVPTPQKGVLYVYMYIFIKGDIQDRKTAWQKHWVQTYLWEDNRLNEWIDLYSYINVGWWEKTQWEENESNLWCEDTLMSWKFLISKLIDRLENELGIKTQSEKFSTHRSDGHLVE